ncbi:hypothetical protein [Bradyrhizobium sp. SSUT18]|uniref:hypothetical protein n=1 Tax=Bradyrhizobium sp. SSUT18 TaxID=3040602 RepID=UPI00244A0299|nr:hypothetical protein [Bradyrhizobium sp. SSUT18]
MDKIWILLAEYNTLRAEVLAARSYMGQGAGIFAAAFMANIAFGYSAGKDYLALTIILGIFVVAYFAALYAWNEKNTISCTARLRNLESAINSLAGERLLVWETVHGHGGIWRKTNPHLQE